MSELMSKLKSVSVEHRGVGTSWASPMCGRAGISSSPFSCVFSLTLRSMMDTTSRHIDKILSSHDYGILRSIQSDMSSLLTGSGRIEIYRTTASLLPLVVLLQSKEWEGFLSSHQPKQFRCPSRWIAAFAVVTFAGPDCPAHTVTPLQDYPLYCCFQLFCSLWEGK